MDSPTSVAPSDADAGATAMTYARHHLCELFPGLSGDEFNALRDDIKANGLRQPIVLHEGKILDGGNRYRACLEAGVEPVFREFDGNTPSRSCSRATCTAAI